MTEAQSIVVSFLYEGLYEQFLRSHPLVRVIMYEIVNFCYKYNYSQPIVTHIERDMAKHIEIYREKAATTPSPHLDRPCRGIDIRTSQWTKEQADHIVRYINSVFVDKDYPYPNALYHNVGRGDHLHIQCKRKAYEDRK